MKEKSLGKVIAAGRRSTSSLRNKSEFFQHVINIILDIILLSKTKSDDSFPSTQFMLKENGISYRLDRNSNGLLLYVCEDIPSKFLKVKSDCNIESIVNTRVTS